MKRYIKPLLLATGLLIAALFHLTQAPACRESNTPAYCKD